MHGVIELYGYSSAFDAHILGGWIDLTWVDPIELPAIKFKIGSTEVMGNGYICLYQRDDVKKRGNGFVLVVDPIDANLENIVALTLKSGSHEYVLHNFGQIKPSNDAQLVDHIRFVIRSALDREPRERLESLLVRPRYTGANTFTAISPPVEIQFDKVYFCPPSGLLLQGWMVDPLKRLAKLKLICGGRSRVINHRAWVRVRRPDVTNAFAGRFELPNDDCGFVAFVPDVFQHNHAVHLEAEMVDGARLRNPLI